MMMMMSRLSVSTGSLLTRSDGPFGNHRVVRGASVIVGRGGGESSSADIFGSNIQHGGNTFYVFRPLQLAVLDRLDLPKML